MYLRKFFWVGVSPTGRVWFAFTDSLAKEFRHPGAPVSDAVFSFDNKRVATSTEDGVAWVWDPVTLQATTDRGANRPHSAGIARVEFLADGARFATLDLSGVAVLWDATGDAPTTAPGAALQNKLI